MSNYAIGIDLGTSTSEIAVYKNGTVQLIPAYDSPTKSTIIPSLVAISLSDQGKIIVGERAKAYIKSSNRCVQEVKRLMGTGEKVSLGDNSYFPQEISAFILMQLKEYAKVSIGEAVKDVVISVPANFNDAQRQATKDAAEIAGFNVLRLINEPTAAAIAYGVNNLNIDECLLVCDFGGGTLDLTILEMVEGILDVKVSHGNTKLGGKDIDEKLAEYIIERFVRENKIQRVKLKIDENDMRRLKSEAEKAKKVLSSGTDALINISNVFRLGKEILNIEDMKITVDDFEKAIRNILDEQKKCVLEVLKMAEMSADAVQNVIFIGGTTYIPAVRKVVEDIFNRKFEFGVVNPDEAVSRGAAIHSAIAQDIYKSDNSLILTDVAPFTLGTSVAKIINNQGVIVIDHLIKKNEKIPHTFTKEDYELLTVDQHAVDIRLYQGDGITENDCEFLTSGSITDIPPSITGRPHRVKIEFSYDLNGIATIKATIPSTNQSLKVVFDKSKSRMDHDEKSNSKTRLEKIWRESPSASDYYALLDAAETLLNQVDKEEGMILAEKVVALKNAIASGNTAEMSLFEDQLTDTILDLKNR